MAAMPEQSIKRTIRRGELRQIVPLADCKRPVITRDAEVAPA